MKIKDIIYNTPEISEEKLLEIIDRSIPMMKKDAINRIAHYHKDVSIAQGFLDEYDLIQDKKSMLTKSQRDQIIGFVGLCMVRMVKAEENKNGGTGSESTSEN